MQAGEKLKMFLLPLSFIPMERRKELTKAGHVSRHDLLPFPNVTKK